MTTVDRDFELQLVARLRAGDAAAFDAVYGAYNRRLFTFLARLSSSRDVAEDLVEETWLRLVAQRDRLQPDTRFGPWLFTVARNLYLSYRRSRMLEDACQPDAADSWPAGCAFRSPFEETAATEFERQLEIALAGLPVLYREVLLLVGVEGLRPAEAAVVCGVKPEALRQRLSRARTLLAERLEETRRPEAAVPREVTP
jgi:RNA polymerase sigma-70 factor (ECF subfamily)